jgi:hypothetical protein
MAANSNPGVFAFGLFWRVLQKASHPRQRPQQRDNNHDAAHGANRMEDAAWEKHGITNDRVLVRTKHFAAGYLTK